MKQISTLIKDIYSTVSKKDGWFDDLVANEFARIAAKSIKGQFQERTGKGTLRMSKMGETCPRALWYSVHHPELAEPMQPWAEIKFSYGHMVEALALTLAKAAGHEVTGEQDALYVDGITGHRDGIIDGCLIDVKSANSRSFEKYKTGTAEDIDLFGNLSQLDGYMVGGMDDPLVRTKDRAYIFAVDKELGKLHLYEHRLRETHIRHRIEWSKRIVERDSAPPCQCGTVPDGESGNVKLDTKSSYNAFKYCCIPTLRTFIYSGGKPRFFTSLVKRPTYKGEPLIEVDRCGNRVYNVV